ncbi:ANK [Musa troglodytarum]|uniref:ANK n=1 Tax=Musa troglodytarum TaxID=320322 RepID=A0A9E7JSW2_9LILI|nr:ANK [Musa troglodytarum]URD91353.1 ANK [Musa troglodytarum]
MTQGNCPSLPSWLLSTVENNTKGTILHFASTKGPGDDQAAVQMQDELIWFEMVRDMVPRELVHYRNDAEKTAQEMFSERHKEMAKACKVQPVGMGQTCSGLLAAVVFASSFSIPGEKDPATGNPVYLGRLPFRIFSHAFVIGLSSAATSLVLFLSLLVAPYKEQQFRRAIPLKYFFACLSFGIALLAFLVAFTCNIFLQIYGGQRSGTKDLIMILLELIVFPVVCYLILFCRGSYFLPSFALALEIARQYPELITSRNEEAVAPLQLMVTIPELFRSQMVLGSLESFLFRLIPLEEDAPKTRDGDEEAPKSMDRADATEEIEEDDYEHLERPRRIRSKFPSQYTPLLDLLELMHIPARWIQVFLFNILKQLSPRIRRLEEIKRTHREALQLIEHLVHKEEYVDFFSQGTDKGKGHAETSNDNGVDKAAHEHAQEVTGERHRESGGRRDQLVIAFAEKFFKFASHGNDKVTAQELRKCMQDAMGALSAESARWNEPPLILGAQMGLPEYVRTILKVSPEAATYLDTEGRSVLQVAIEHGNLEIVETIREMTEGHNPILPSWLLSSVDETTGETILHFASVKGPDNYQDAVQMQDELRCTDRPTHAADAGTGSTTKEEKMPSASGSTQPADGAGRGGSEEPPHALDVARFRRLNWLIHRENVDVNELLRLVEQDNHVNLMNDPLLSVVIACNKPELAVRLIEKISNDILEAYNYNGDTALHVAAAMDDKKVALELIRRMPDLVHKRNVKQEIPLHKAALYGLQDMFWLLVAKKSSPEARREDGATMLHCAIMGNAPVLALQIAQGHRHQIESRNEHALTPLQLLVTIPEAFRSQVVLGALDSFIYDWIPLEEDSSKMNKRDEEAANRSSIGVAQEDDGDHSPRSFRSKFPSNYSTLFDLLEFINIPVSPRVQRMERKKKNHTETMHLIEYLAQAGYFEFFVRGKDPTQVTTIASEALDGQFGPPETPPETVQEGHAEKKDTEAPDAVKELIQGMSDKLYKLVSVESETPVSTAIKEAAQSVEKVLKALSPSSEERWNEPPLILGAQMGLHDFVGKILQVCPQSATYLDTKGRNVLRVAIESGNRETVETIRGMTQGDNPILPSWLLSSIDSKTRNTILHFASEKVGDAGDDAVQMQDEIRWFEMVKEMVPRELVYSRNTDEKTAREIFTESHKEMFKNCKNQLMEMGKTCSGLVAAVVFASSFSIPGEKDPRTGNPVYFNRLPFKVFTHAYVIGLSCAATSLVLFLSLVISPYKEQQFRRAIPTKYFFACFSFGLALTALLLAFICNIFLQIYGGQTTLAKDIAQLVLELAVFPIVCLDGTEDADPPHEHNRRHFLTVKSHIRQMKHKELLALAEKDPDRPVNLMADTLLHVVIACNKTDLAKSIIRQMPVETLVAKNLYGDTALHVAAAVGNSEVAKELFGRSKYLIGEQNLKQETPLHKAAFYGHHDMFMCLVDDGKGSPFERREVGATMLHCANMGNAPGLALEIAENFPVLITSRNTMAVTPLQLMVTVPGLFRSQMVLGSSESILYYFIPLEKDSHRTRRRDEEEAAGSFNDALYPRTRHLDKIKRTHRKALELIEYLARDPTNMEFDVLGRKQDDGGAPAAGLPERGGPQDQPNASAASIRRWNEPPLILGAQMGIPEFVSTILQVCPEAATYLDTRGRSVLQVAIEHGNREIVRTIREMTRGKNPILRSWLLSRVDKRTGRTIALCFGKDPRA